MKPYPHRSRGFGLIETVLGVLVLVVVMAITVNFVRNQSNAAKRAQETDQNARELALVAKAAKVFVAAQAATTYPLDTTVAVPISSLISSGNLPANFAQRLDAGTGPITPFGQPYVVVARRIEADKPPTIVVAESGAANGDKLRATGVEAQEAPIFSLKEQVAQRTAKDYQAVAGTIARNSRMVTGTGQSFTKDLTAYFAGAFTEASAVALANFKDLEPDDDDGGNGEPLDGGPKYTNCRVMQGQLIAGNTSFYNICSNRSGPGGSDMGYRIVGDRDMSVCSGNGEIVVLPFGGTLTSGLDESGLWYPSNSGTCPSDWDASALRCNRQVGTTKGKITMNSVVVASHDCKIAFYASGMYRETLISQAGYNVCCHVD